MRSNLNIHGVNKIEYSEIRAFEKTANRKAFFSRDILITDIEGHIFEVTIFGENESELILTQKEGA